jgi:hypothetical protein
MKRGAELLATLKEWCKAHEKEHALEQKVEQVRYEGIDRRLHDMNELRKQIENERGTFVTRELHDRDIATLCESIGELRASRDTSSGVKNLTEQLWPFVLAVLMFLAGHVVWR